MTTPGGPINGQGRGRPPHIAERSRQVPASAQSVNKAARPRRRETTLVRQKEIIDAARKLIIKYGSEHITVKRIAAQVGISEGAIYRHFKSKRDILSLLAEHVGDNLIGDIEGSYEAGEARQPMQVLEGILRNHLSAIAQRKGVSFQVIAEIISLGDKRLNKKVADIINTYNQRITAVLSEGVKAGEVRNDVDLDAAATMFFGMVQGLVSIWTLSDHRFSLEEECGSLWDLFSRAVAKR